MAGPLEVTLSRDKHTRMELGELGHIDAALSTWGVILDSVSETQLTWHKSEGVGVSSLNQIFQLDQLIKADSL